MRFARFLGDRWLVNDYRWRPEGLLLRQRFFMPMRINKAGLIPFLFHGNSSNILLAWNGEVTAQHLEKNGQIRTRPRLNGSPNRKPKWPRRSFAWRAFRDGNLQAAERAIGEKPESEIFVVPARPRRRDPMATSVAGLGDTYLVVGDRAGAAPCRGGGDQDSIPDNGALMDL